MKSLIYKSCTNFFIDPKCFTKGNHYFVLKNGYSETTLHEGISKGMKLEKLTLKRR